MKTIITNNHPKGISNIHCSPEKGMVRKPKMYLFLLLAFSLLYLNTAFGQAPEGINYQAAVRDNAGMILANQSVSFQLSILEGGANGTAIYVETQTATTSSLGLVDFQIGGGSVVSGNFSVIDWGSNTYFLKVEMDPAGGTSYANMGVSKLVSVPYALFAKNVENDQVDDADADPANEFNTSFTLTGSDLTLTDGGGTHTVTLPSMTEVDGDTTNELQDITLTGTDLSISQGSTVDLSVLQDGVTDADADPNNELQTLSLSGSNLTLSQGGGTVSIDDADADPANEIQVLSMSNDSILLSNGGGSVDLSTYLDSPWEQSGNYVYNLTDSIGIGTASPQNKMELWNPGNSELRISSYDDALLILEGDRNNVGEDDNAGIFMYQDGNLLNYYIGLNGNANQIVQGANSNGMLFMADSSGQNRSF